MNVLDWLPSTLASARVDVPPAFSQWLATGEQEFGGWFLLDEPGAIANRTKLGQLYSLREILPFARRGDCDDVACLVLSNPDHPHGTVLLIHDGAMQGSEVEKVVASLSQWFEQAQNE